MAPEYKFVWKCIDNFNTIKGRSVHCISCINNILYLLWGEILPRTPIDSKIYYKNLNKNIDNNWKILEINSHNVPLPRIGHAQIIVGENIWIFGGRQGITMNELPLNDMWFFNTIKKTWNKVIYNNDIDIPIPRSFHKMININNMIYIFGGCSEEGRLADLHCFNIDNFTWKKLCNPLPCMLGRGGAGFLPSSDNNSLFVVGGFTGKESNSVYRFDLIKESWDIIYQEGNEIIKPFSVSAGILFNDNLVFFGGEIDPSLYGHLGAGNFSNSLLILDGLSGKKLNEPVFKNTLLPPSRGWFDATKWDNKMIIFGGLSGNDDFPIRLNDTWTLESI